MFSTMIVDCQLVVFKTIQRSSTQYWCQYSPEDLCQSGEDFEEVHKSGHCTRQGDTALELLKVVVRVGQVELSRELLQCAQTTSTIQVEVQLNLWGEEMSTDPKSTCT